MSMIVRSRAARSPAEERWLGRKAKHDLVQGRWDVLAREHRVAGDRAVDDRGERVDIGAVIDVLAARLLRRHVRGCADHMALREGSRSASLGHSEVQDL